MSASSVPRRAALGLLLAAGPALAQRLPPAVLIPPPAGPTVAAARAGEAAIRLWEPGEVGPATRLILFSPGAALPVTAYDALAGAWALEGHVAAVVAHADPPPGDPAAARAGFAARVAAMRAAAAELAQRWPGRPLVAAGHSYGALVAQVLGGARPEWPADGGPLPLPGVAAVVGFSPPGPLPGFIDAAGLARIAVPLFVATGTADVTPPVAVRWEDRLAGFEAATVPRWAWVGAGVDHYFGNRIGRPERPADPVQSRLFEAALLASLAFIEGAAPPEQPEGATLTVRGGSAA